MLRRKLVSDRRRSPPHEPTPSPFTRAAPSTGDSPPARAPAPAFEPCLLRWGRRTARPRGGDRGLDRPIRSRDRTRAPPRARRRGSFRALLFEPQEEHLGTRRMGEVESAASRRRGSRAPRGSNRQEGDRALEDERRTTLAGWQIEDVAETGLAHRSLKCRDQHGRSENLAKDRQSRRFPPALSGVSS